MADPTSSPITGWKTTGIVGTLALGVLGSAMWDVALKPVFRAAQIGLLNLTSLGLNGVRNATYRDAARGLHEGLTVIVLSLLLGTGLGMALPVLTSAVTNKLQRARNSELQSHEKLLLRNTRVIAAIVLFVIGYFTTNIIRQVYATSLAGYFEQSIRVIGPDISPEQRLEIQSQWSQMQTRDDFLRLYGGIRQAAVAHHRRLPDFIVW